MARETGGLVVRTLRPGDWPRLWALYERVFDAAEGPDRTDFSGWTRGSWPLPGITRAALDAGFFRGAREGDEGADGAGELVGAYILNSDLEDMPVQPSWEPLEPSEFLALHQLTVTPSKRGQGLGRRLVEAAIEEARARGMRALRLNTATVNREANGLYTSMGFTRYDAVPYDFGDIPIPSEAVPYEYRL